MKLRVRTRRVDPGDEGGFALIVVLLVLLALLVLATPYLSSAHDADRASAQLADRAAARVGLDAASRRVRSMLQESYPSADVDKTPYFDGLDEIHVDNAFPPGFYDADDPRGPMWDVALEDDAGRIDLNSASPHVLANLLDLTTRFTQVVASDAKELPLASRGALAPTGFLWCEGELVRYTKLEDALVTAFVRGVFGPTEASDWRGGPRPAVGHRAGAPVVDQRAFAPAVWRTRGVDGDLRPFASFEELPQSGLYVREAAAAGAEAPAPYPGELVATLVAHGTVYSGPRGGARWQHPVRLTSPVTGKKDGRFQVSDLRWFNPGTTVRVRDGRSTELAIVQEIAGGAVVLDRILDEDYAAYTTVVDVLARRPVNVNTAPRAVLTALFRNLEVAGHNSRITNDEAEQLADVVLESRPFEGFEDFLRRVVLPSAGIEKLPSDEHAPPQALAAGTGFLDPWDALALYTNALNANDGTLAYATMPFSFTSRDTYAYELRSTVQAPSGLERASLVRDEVALIVPQQELTRLWARQEDFDEELRLSLDAPWFATGPNATTRYDGGSVPPSRLWAHMGTAEGRVFVPGISDPSVFGSRESPPTPEHVFASREDQAFVQLMTLREDDQAFQRRVKRVLHFDHETRDPEGRWLPDKVVSIPTDDETVQWTTPSLPLMRPFSCSMWIKPRQVNDAKYLDVAGTSGSVDRVSLLVERGDLVLRVIDGFGDHRDTTFSEAGELRYAITGAGSPGLPADTWSHVEIDVRGNRPSQMHMLVNGLAHGVRTLGLTRLTSSLALGSAQIGVESTEGFPDACVVRIGNELIEVVKSGATSLDATRHTTGRLAGFGGRLAREQMQTLSDIQPMVPLALQSIVTDHPAGTPVELWGYAAPLFTDVTTGSADLPGPLGPFRVGRAVAVVGGQGALGEPITIGIVGFTIGYGMKGANSTVTALELASADKAIDPSATPVPTDYMPAFHRDGGYAVLIQTAPTQNNQPLLDNDGKPIGGMEIIRYSGWTGSTLQIAQRGIDSTVLRKLQTTSAAFNGLVGGTRSFVTRWNDILGVDPPLFTQVDSQLYVVPISLAVPGVGQVQGFLDPPAGESRFAQITHVDDAEKTEWVRYDEVEYTSGHLVRDDPNALLALYRCLVHANVRDIPAGVGAGPGGGGKVASASSSSAAIASSAPVAVPLQQTTNASAAWDPRIGETENDPALWAVSRTAETNFQFRGVAGTYSHQHADGTRILPVFGVRRNPYDGGRPGRLDAVFAASFEPGHVGWPLTVHRSYVASPTYEVLGWRQATDSNVATYVSPTDTNGIQIGGITEPFLLNMCWFAFQDRCPEILTPGTQVPNPNLPMLDSRLMARLSCFPSGERPRAVSRVVLGGGANGAPGAIPAALIDEVVFGDAKFGREMPSVDPEHVAGGSLVVLENFDEGANTFRIEPKSARIALATVGSTRDLLGDWPADGGLARIGDEILAYQSVDAADGRVNVATNGRGLLGTRAQAHQVGESVLLLEDRVVSVLGAGAAAGDGVLSVASTQDFAGSDTVLVGEELITYTRVRQGTLEMPRASMAAGAMDERGDGIFRGRFGTAASTHAAGEAVIRFPTRYPDRWTERADAPEMSWFGLSVDQPAAMWNGFWFSKVDTESARVGVLVRTRSEVPWDADPEDEKRLRLVWQGETQEGQVPIGLQSDRVEFRVFVDYQSGAFDARTGLAHGWKATPRLRMFGAFYHAPSVVLRSVER